MRRITLLLLLCIGLTVQGRQYEYESVEGDLLGARIYTLDNGLKVYLSVNTEKPRIQTFIAVHTGSRNDPAETTGLAHYLEHLMFKGTAIFGTSDAEAEAPLLDSIEARFEHYRTITDPDVRRAYYAEIDSLSQLAAEYNIPNEYDKLMASIGAIGTNAYTSNDITCYTEDIPSNELENWAKVQSDRFQNMVIRGFHTELEAVYEEYNMGLTQDMRKVWESACKVLFPTHPYGTQTTIGTQEHLKNPSITNIKEYFRQYYVPNNVAICMSGDLDPDATIELLDKYFGEWKANENLTMPKYEPVEKLTTVVDTTVVGNDAECLMMGWAFEGANSLQTDTLEMIAYMLNNETAGLFDLDLNQKMACLFAGVGFEKMNEYSMFYFIAYPKEGQTLEELRTLLLQEVDKLKAGDFDDALVPSVVNNLKLEYRRSLEKNNERADAFVWAFVNDVPWEQAVRKYDRMELINKGDITAFAKKHLTDNYVTVFKLTGEDTLQAKIDKPHITAIPANRDKQSDFVAEIISSEPDPIQPRFVDFNKDMTKSETKDGLPILHVHDESNGIFTLTYHYNFGGQADKWWPLAASYLDYIGTNKKSAEDISKELYALACEKSISVREDEIDITITGLAENMLAALEVVEDFLQNAMADEEAYDEFVGVELKNRTDAKLNQQANFNALYQYGIYGEYNSLRNVPDSTELVSRNPAELVDMIKSLKGIEHEICYCGPLDITELSTILNKQHKTANKLAKTPENKAYTTRQTTDNEIILAPYAAKNIYMRQYNNEGRQWKAEDMPVIELFNEYFGGGMNSIVFQEMRESRALAYSANGRYMNPNELGKSLFAVTSIITQNDKMMDCINTFGQILDTIPQSDSAFDLAMQGLKKRLATNRTTKFDIIRAYFKARKTGIDYDINEKVYMALPTLTLNDIVTFEKSVMAHKPWLYMILGDENELDIDALEKIAPVKRVTTDEIFGY